MSIFKAKEFVLELLDSSLDEELKIQLMRTLLKKGSMRRSQISKYHTWLDLTDNPIIKIALFNEISAKEFLWLRERWGNIEHFLFTEIDSLLLRSAHHKDWRIRNAIIKLLGEQTPKPFPFHFSVDNIKFSEFIDKFYYLNKTQNFIDLEDLEKPSLKEFFLNIQNLVHDDYTEGVETKIEPNSHLISYEEMRTFEISPLQIHQALIANLPKQILLKLAYEDPKPENRREAVIQLSKSEFWIKNQQNQLLTIGPIFLLITAFVTCLNAISHDTKIINQTRKTYEEEKSVSKEASELFKSLYESTKYLSYGNLTSLKSALLNHKDIKKLLSQENVKESFELYIFKTKILDLTTDVKMLNVSDPKLADHLLGEELLESIHNLSESDIITELIESKRSDLKQILINNITEYLHANKSISDKIKFKLITYLDPLTKDQEIRIRTASQGLKTKLKIQ